MFKCIGNCAACGRCKSTALATEVNNRKTEMLWLPDDFVADDNRQSYTLALDVGTTTVVGMLWDIQGAKLLGSAAETNPQTQYGRDVISRIAFAGNEENRQLLQEAIIGCANRIIATLCKQFEIDHNDITKASVCGNTTMSHLFAGYDPKSLAKAPFEPAYTGAVEINAAQLGLDINENGQILLLPNIAGHVGGDITAGILATRLEEKSGNVLFIDIGTNGEIVYSQDGEMLTCSTAAGPAFEGAHIYQGMRAAEGAIERVRIEGGDVQFKTIGNVPPVGICGSGLIDAIYEMKKAGLIDKTGRIVEGYQEGPNGRCFVLVNKANGEDIIITQKDIREVQLAKAAVAAGATLLMQQLGSSAEQLDEIILAGAFGSTINKDSAVGIGLLPDIARDKITIAGNTAGAGTLMTAASTMEAQRAKQIPGMLQHIELANLTEFQKEYLGAMGF